MPALLRHSGKVEGRVLLLRNLSLWRENVARLEGVEVEVTIKRLTQPVSQDQHGYYRSTILPLLAEEWGWGDPRELHHEFKLLHLPGIIPVEEWPKRRVGNDWRREVPSMADFTREQASAFIQKVLDQAADARVIVPPPRGSAEQAHTQEGGSA
jgi:hypothetical protein